MTNLTTALVNWRENARHFREKAGLQTIQIAKLERELKELKRYAGLLEEQVDEFALKVAQRKAGLSP